MKKKTIPKEEDVIELKSSVREEVAKGLMDNPFYGLQESLKSIENSEALAKTSQKFIAYAVYVSVVLLVVAIAGWSRTHETVYIIQNADGAAYRTTASGRPFINNKVLKRFGMDIAAGFHTFSYRNYGEKYRAMQEYCEDSVIKDLFNKNEKTGVFTAIKDYSQRYESIATKMNVVKQFPEKDPVRWELRGVVNEEVISASGQPLINNFDITIHVKRVPLYENARGIMCYKVMERYAK
jgi:hypothetical protein